VDLLAVSDGSVILIIALVAIPVAGLFFVLGAGSALRAIGKGQFAIEQELPQKQGGSGSMPVSREVREAEIRQMVEAKAYRREARGGEPIDVEAEVQRLLDDTPAPSSLSKDKGLRDEVRQLVVARNERRQRQGKEPLDVDEEIERQLRELENLGQ
jgi:hypothetical protein